MSSDSATATVIGPIVLFTGMTLFVLSRPSDLSPTNSR